MMVRSGVIAPSFGCKRLVARLEVTALSGKSGDLAAQSHVQVGFKTPEYAATADAPLSEALSTRSGGKDDKSESIYRRASVASVMRNHLTRARQEYHRAS
jgi:hypothetical protein